MSKRDSAVPLAAKKKAPITPEKTREHSKGPAIKPKRSFTGTGRA